MTTAAIERVKQSSNAQRVVAKSGACVAIVEEDGRERIEVRDAKARLVLEIDPVTGKTTVVAPGDLALRAGGDLELEAKGAVRVKAGDIVELEAGDGAAKTSFSVGGAIAKLSARVLAVSAEETRYVGEILRAKIDDTWLELSRVESAAERVIERAKNVFREVEDLCQTKAGRSRTVIEGGAFFRAHHASIEAEDEMRIDGSSINLG